MLGDAVIYLKILVFIPSKAKFTVELLYVTAYMYICIDKPLRNHASMGNQTGQLSR